jgi:hypothetical protein
MLKDIPNYEGIYMASDDGKIWSCHSRKFLKPMKSKAGYYRVSLPVNGKYKKIPVHRLIAKTFIPNPQNKPTVNHKNEIKTDNRVCNLEWATILEQNIHGTRIKRAVKHTNYKARNIDYKIVASKHDYVAIAKKCSKPILQMDMDGNVLQRFESITIAHQQTGANMAHIVMCAKGKGKSCGGYKWAYAN